MAVLESKVSIRYAKSILDLATEQNVLEDVKSDMMYVLEVYKASRSLKNLLHNPIVSTDKKQAIFKEVFARCSPLTLKFFNLVSSKHREQLFSSIATSFMVLYHELKGIKQAYITTAIAIGESERIQFSNYIQKLGYKQVEIYYKVDATLLGGFVIQVADQQINASVKHKLSKIKNSLMYNPYVAKL